MATPWRKQKEISYQAGYRKILKRTYLMPDGRVVDFDIVDERQVVCMLALTKDNQVILVEQFRPGPEKVLLELPGGGVEEGETPIETAKRELLEEAGYIGELEKVGTSIQSAYSSMIRTNFIVKNCEKIAEIANDDDEFTEVVLMSLNDFRNHVRTGEMTDVSTAYLCLDYLHLL